MNTFFRQFKILLWKCWILKRRHYMSSFFEFFLPLLTSVTMVIAVSAFTPTKLKNPTKGSTGYQVGPTIFNYSTFDLNKNLNTMVSPLLMTSILYASSNNCTDKFMNEVKKELNSRINTPDPSHLHYEALKSEEEIDLKFSVFKGSYLKEIIFILNFIIFRSFYLLRK